MAGRLIGDAWISILADTSMLRPDADAKVKAALKGLQGSIGLTANATDVEAKIAAIAAALKSVDGEIPVSMDATGFIHDIAGLTRYAISRGWVERTAPVPRKPDAVSAETR